MRWPLVIAAVIAVGTSAGAAEPSGSQTTAFRQPASDPQCRPITDETGGLIWDSQGQPFVWCIPT